MGAAAGLGFAAYGLFRMARQPDRGSQRRTALDVLEEAAVDALRADEITGNCAIDVTAIAPGILELTGSVPDHDTAERAARVLHAVAGVRTVVNRLDTESLHELRSRAAAGAVAIPDVESETAFETA